VIDFKHARVLYICNYGVNLQCELHDSISLLPRQSAHDFYLPVTINMAGLLAAGWADEAVGWMNTASGMNR